MLLIQKLLAPFLLIFGVFLFYGRVTIYPVRLSLQPTSLNP